MILRALNYDPVSLRYKGIIGTGGIGSGKFFVLNGDHTLGREESRSGHFLEINDYCKQHIILHYIKVLLGRPFEVIPVGKVGNDDTGKILLNEMEESGFEMKFLQREPDVSTLFSFCFYYPDGSGGNLTTDNSASSSVDRDYIDMAIPEMQRLGKRGIVMAAPEVPLDARKRLIELGDEFGLFCTASFTRGETEDLLKSDIVKKIGLIAINSDEASAIAALTMDPNDNTKVVKRAIQNLAGHNRNIMVSITAGKDGSWCWDGKELRQFPAVKADAVSTAGAGDAFFSGIISGLTLGLTLFESQQLASLVAGLSVCSPDTINKTIDRDSLRTFLRSSGMSFSKNILNLLED